MTVTDDKNTTRTLRTDSTELETVIATAIDKVGADKENDLCRYLPVSTGGYMHHFTMRKMKNEDPGELQQMIRQYIIETADPQTVEPKKRAARGSRRRREQHAFSKQDWDKMLRLARESGDGELIAKLTPKKPLGTIKRELTATIRQGKVDQELWNQYVEAIAAQATATTNHIQGSTTFTDA